MKSPYICLSLVLVAILVVPGGYAYFSDMTTSGSTTNDSFTVALYSDGSIVNGSISYKTESGQNVIVEDIYSIISGAHLLIAGNGTYSVSFEVHFYDDNGEIESESYLFIDDTPASECTLQGNTQYNIQLNTFFSSSAFSGTVRCNLILRVYALHNGCTYDDMNDCATIEVHDDPVADLIDVTEGSGIGGEYIKTTTTVGGVPQVIISNSTNTNGQGVADADGNINIILNIPANTPFCIKIWNRESYDIRADIVVSNIIINGSSTSHSYNNQNLGSGFARYFCHYTYRGSTYWSTTNLNNVVNNNGWFYSSNGSVTISIDAHYDDGHGNKAQDVRLSVIFEDQI